MNDSLIIFAGCCIFWWVP